MTAAMEEAGFAVGGPLQYAPKDHQVKVWTQFKAEDDEALGRAYADLEDGITIVSQAAAEVEREAEEPPSVSRRAAEAVEG